KIQPHSLSILSIYLKLSFPINTASLNAALIKWGCILSSSNQTINIWLDEDKIQPNLIKEALREAVLIGKLNFKYIDRMLREWQKKGIRSVKQAKEVSRSFRTDNAKKEYQKEERDTSVYFNWLKGE